MFAFLKTTLRDNANLDCFLTNQRNKVCIFLSKKILRVGRTYKYLFNLIKKLHFTDPKKDTVLALVDQYTLRTLNEELLNKSEV